MSIDISAHRSYVEIASRFFAGLTKEREDDVIAADDADGIGGFYDWLAPDFDRMTGFDQRIEREKPRFQELVERFRIRRAVDAGCGTGFHSVLLARLGVEVTGVDLSAEMVGVLRERARAGNLPITALVSSFEELSRKVAPGVDAVFCLGNSLPHLLTMDALGRALKNFADVMRPEGVLVVQILNYDRILASRERVQNVKEAGGVTYIRFYDFANPLIRFNILKLTRHAGGISHELRSTTLRPLKESELRSALAECGFGEVRVYGGLAGEAYAPGGSKDLVLFARRSAVSSGTADW